MSDEDIKHGNRFTSANLEGFLNSTYIFDKEITLHGAQFAILVKDGNPWVKMYVPMELFKQNYTLVPKLTSVEYKLQKEEPAEEPQTEKPKKLPANKLPTKQTPKKNAPKRKGK